MSPKPQSGGYEPGNGSQQQSGDSEAPSAQFQKTDKQWLAGATKSDGYPTQMMPPESRPVPPPEQTPPTFTPPGLTPTMPPGLPLLNTKASSSRSHQGPPPVLEDTADMSDDIGHEGFWVGL